jgi:transposase
MIGRRLCPGCRQFFPLTERHFRKNRKGDGPKSLSNRCRLCMTRTDKIGRLRRRLEGLLPIIRPLAEIERAAIERAIVLTGCPEHAAKLLGIGKATIYRRMRAYAKLPPLKPAYGVKHPVELRKELAALQERDAQIRRDAKESALAKMTTEHSRPRLSSPESPAPKAPTSLRKWLDGL